jgi:hypothetical protein
MGGSTDSFQSVTPEHWIMRQPAEHPKPTRAESAAQRLYRRRAAPAVELGLFLRASSRGLSVGGNARHRSCIGDLVDARPDIFLDELRCGSLQRAPRALLCRVRPNAAYEFRTEDLAGDATSK